MPGIWFRLGGEGQSTYAHLDFAGDYEPGDPRPEGYIDRQEWFDVQLGAGLEDVRCGRCSKWKFPQELSDHVDISHPWDSRGNRVEVRSPICLACAASASMQSCKAGGGNEFMTPEAPARVECAASPTRRDPAEPPMGRKANYRPAEVAAILGVTVRTVANMCDRGELGHYKLDSGWRVVPHAALVAYLAARPALHPALRAIGEEPPAGPGEGDAGRGDDPG